MSLLKNLSGLSEKYVAPVSEGDRTLASASKNAYSDLDKVIESYFKIIKDAGSKPPLNTHPKIMEIIKMHRTLSKDLPKMQSLFLQF